MHHQPSLLEHHCKVSQSIYFKNRFFLQQYLGILDIYDAPSSLQEEILLQVGKHICPAWWCDGPVSVIRSKNEYGGCRGKPHPWMSAAQRSTDRLPRCAAGPAPSLEGINQDNSLHALNSDLLAIHTNVSGRNGGAGGVKGQDRKRGVM